MSGLMVPPLRKAFNILLITALLFGLVLNLAPQGTASAAAMLMVTNLNDSGPGSLRQVIDDAAPGDVVYFMPGLTGTIGLTSGRIIIDKSLTIAGPGPDVIAISGSFLSTVIEVSRDIHVMIGGVTVKDGKTVNYQGGGIWNEGNLVLNNVKVVGNEATTFAGGIYNNVTGVLSIYNSLISNNIVTGMYEIVGAGGGIWNDGQITIYNSSVVNNQADLAGGGVYNNEFGVIQAKNSHFDFNNLPGIFGTTGQGGGIYNYTNGQIYLINSTVNGNTANSLFSSGGGIANFYGGYIYIDHSKVNGNYSYGTGGGIDNYGAVEIHYTTIADNIAYGEYADGTPYGDGGGIETAGQMLLTKSTVSGNYANHYGGGIDKWLGSLSVYNSTITGNASDVDGGGIYNFAHWLEAFNVTITGNTADANSDGFGNGGGIYNDNTPDPTGGTANKPTHISPETPQVESTIPTYVSLVNSILAGNVDMGGESPDCGVNTFLSGTLTSQGYNIIGDTTGCPISGPATDDQYNVDPMLKALNNNGGPTLTHSLQFGSPAIDKANDAVCPPVDQRGAPRPFDGDYDGTARCDIGAYEVRYGPNPPNEAPFANPQTVETFEDMPLPVTITGADPEGDPITFAIVAPPAHGALSGTVPNLLYTPAPNFYGADSFAFTVTDTFGGVSVALVTINVLPVNDVPLVNAGPDQTVVEGDTVAFNGSFTDPDLEDTHTIFWDFGDGSSAAGSLTPTHVFPGPGTYTVTLYVTDSAGTTGFDSLIVTVQALVDLTLTKTVNIDPAIAGTEIIYTLTVENHGPSPAKDVVLEDELAEGLTFVAASAGCVEDMGVVTCDLGTINPGEFVNVDITLYIELETAGTLVNLAEVTTTDFDANLVDNKVAFESDAVPYLFIYENDFEGFVGPEWTSTYTETTPTGRGFLGQFTNDTVTLTLPNLPPHKTARIAFDLYLIRSWDGNQIENLIGPMGVTPASPNEIVGPDQWTMKVDDKTQLNSTFSNWDVLGYRQAYPQNYPGGVFPSLFGAVEYKTLGFTYRAYPQNVDLPMDSVYRLTFNVPHTAKTLTIDLSAFGLQTIDDESWGIDNILVMLTAGNEPLPMKIYVPLAVNDQ